MRHRLTQQQKNVLLCKGKFSWHFSSKFYDGGMEKFENHTHYKVSFTLKIEM
jgi:hypothetical protein